MLSISSQRRRVRWGNVPSQTSSSNGRWNEWRGMKAGSPQRIPLSDVPKADTVLGCGRKLLQEKCAWWSKVFSLWQCLFVRLRKVAKKLRTFLAQTIFVTATNMLSLVGKPGASYFPNPWSILVYVSWIFNHSRFSAWNCVIIKVVGWQKINIISF